MSLAMSVQYDDRKVLAKLKHMEKKAAQKAIKKGVTAGRKKTLAVARHNAASLENVGTGMAEKIASSLVSRVTPKKTLKAKDAWAKEITFNPKKVEANGLIYISKEGVRSFIPFAIEYGHAAPYQGGSKNKVASPKPFMRVAHEQTKGESMRIAKKVITQEIRKAWNK